MIGGEEDGRGIFGERWFDLDMAYPTPIPTFTSAAFEKTLDRIEESTVSEEEKAAVDEVRTELQRTSRDDPRK